MSYNSGVIVLVTSNRFEITIWNHSPDYSLNCTSLSPITITYYHSNCYSLTRLPTVFPHRARNRWTTRTGVESANNYVRCVTVLMLSHLFLYSGILCYSYQFSARTSVTCCSKVMCFTFRDKVVPRRIYANFTALKLYCISRILSSTVFTRPIHEKVEQKQRTL